MKLGFKVGFLTALGALSAYYVYILVSFALTNFVVQPLIGRLLGGE